MINNNKHKLTLAVFMSAGLLAGIPTILHSMEKKIEIEDDENFPQITPQSPTPDCIRRVSNDFIGLIGKVFSRIDKIKDAQESQKATEDLWAELNELLEALKIQFQTQKSNLNTSATLHYNNVLSQVEILKCTHCKQVNCTDQTTE